MVLGLSFLLGGTSFAAYRYDTATRERILPGVRVEGVDVGGMTRTEAMQAVEDAAARTLERDIQVRVADQTWTVSPAELGGAADVQAAVDQAMAITGEFGWLSRVFHRVLDRPIERSFRLRYTHDPAQLDRFVQVVAREVRIRPAAGRIDLEDGKLKKVEARQGRALQAEASVDALESALVRGDAVAEFAVQTLEAKQKAKKGKSPYTIVVRIDKNKLVLYKGLEKVKTYRVATGSPGFPTPKGEWNIWHKAVNPTWINPAPNGWGAGMPRSIPGGPNSPLGTRALYLDAPGIRIHGTANSASIGTYASHGCIRMLMHEVEELYEIVPINTRVLIV